MTDRYPHTPTCSCHYSEYANCDCGAEREQSAFEAGKREADARAMAVVEAAIAEQASGLDCFFCEREEPFEPTNGEFWHHETCPLVVHGFIGRDGGR
jgi:hypothetical protein